MLADRLRASSLGENQSLTGSLPPVPRESHRAGYEELGRVFGSTQLSAGPVPVFDVLGVENELHYTLDVTFREDSSRIRKGSGPEVS